MYMLADYFFQIGDTGTCAVEIAPGSGDPTQKQALPREVSYFDAFPVQGPAGTSR